MSTHRVGGQGRLALAVMAWLMLVPSACVMQQGEAPTPPPAVLLSGARDMEKRGDVVARDHLLEVAQRTHPGSVSAVQATLERASTSPGLLHAAVLGALGAARIPAAAVNGCPVEDGP